LIMFGVKKTILLINWVLFFFFEDFSTKKMMNYNLSAKC
jgi:hypothetical protein